MFVVVVHSTEEDFLDVLTMEAAVSRFADQDISHLVLSVTDLASDDLNRKMVEFIFFQPVDREKLLSVLTLESPQYETKEPVGSVDPWAGWLLLEEGVDIDAEFNS